MPPLGCAAFTWDGIYEGATSSRPVRNAMLGAMVGFFAVWFLLRGQIATVGTGSPSAMNEQVLHLLMGAYFVHLLVRTVWLSILYRRSILVQPFQQAAP